MATALLGCPKRVEPPREVAVPPPPEPDRLVARVTDLLTAVGLRWVVLLEPARIASVGWLKPHLGRLLADERLDALASSTGIDVRVVSEAVLAGYGDGDTVAYFLRHPAEQALVERRFRARLTADVTRRRWDHQLVTLWGRIGDAPHGYVGIGRDVAGFQYGGDATRGPMRLAVLYATGELDEIPTLSSQRGVGPLHEALGDAPAKLILPGPFEGEMARGARGLFTAAEGVAMGLTPRPNEQLVLQVLLAGDYGSGDDVSRAADIAGLAWGDVARSGLGHLLGLTTEGVISEPHPLGIQVLVPLDAAALADGLAAATMDEVREFLK